MARDAQEAGGGRLKTGVETDEVFHVETHGIDQIPMEDRHGSPRELFFVWMGSNLIFTYVIFGSIVGVLGVGFGVGIVAIVLGNLLFLAVGYGGVAGPSTGTSTLVISRGQFGPFGNIPSCIMNWFNVVGFTAVNAVVGTLSLQALAVEAGLKESDVLKAVCLAVVVGLTFVVAILGHATLVVIQRWFTYGLAVGSILLAIYVLPDVEPSALGGGSVLGGFLIAFLIAASGPLSYIATPADFSRYLPKDTPAGPITYWAGFGAMIPAIGLGIVGLAASTVVDMTDPVAGVAQIVPSGFLIPFLAIIVGGAITNNIVNLYSSGLDLQVMYVPLARSRTVFIDGAVATLLAIYALFISDFTSTLIAFISLVVIWMAPWGAIYLIDIVLRRNRYDNEALHERRGGAYHYEAGWNVRGLIALALGVLASGLFANSTKWRGPLVDLIDGGDLSAIAGPIVAGIVYILLMAPVIRKQNAELEAAAGAGLPRAKGTSS